MEDQLNNWSELESTLKDLYNQIEKSESFNNDLDYLRTAYYRVETLWKSVVLDLPLLRMVLLAEAPMFGPEEKYFYNPAAGASEFFTYLDAEALVGELCATSRLIDGERPRKADMLKRLTRSGFLVLDLFPFAFRPGYTAVDYRKLSNKPLYSQLFQKTSRQHLIPKLSLIKTKIVETTVFVFRYSRVHQALESDVGDILQKCNPRLRLDKIDSIHSGRNINRERLKDLFMQTNS